MIAALVIVFREMLEAGLVVGVVLAATHGLRGRVLWISLGIAGGVLGACVVALFAGDIASLFQGSGQELLNAVVLLVAVVMLAWHNAWMASHGRDLARELEAVGVAVAAGQRPLTALAIVCGTAVLREGSEVVLFLYGATAGSGTSMRDVLTGGLLGVVAGAAVSALLYLGLITLPLKYLFKALAALITLLAAGLAAQAVDFLQQAGWIDVWSTPLWDSSSILSQDSLVGRILHTLIGYIDRPNGMELTAYTVVIFAMIALTLGKGPKRVRAQAPSGHEPANIGDADLHQNGHRHLSPPSHRT